jgi:hypothetical protein
MTIDEFRRLALSFPETEERAHMGHPDFRVIGKIFATLGSPNEEYGMVKLSPEQQKTFVKAHPDVFQPVKGGWGRQGCTNVHLASATEKSLRGAMGEAWKLASEKKPARAKRKA